MLGTFLTAQGSGLPALLSAYRTGDAEQAIRALASWSAASIERADLGVGADDKSRLALGVFFLDAWRISRQVGAGPQEHDELHLRALRQIDESCLARPVERALAPVCQATVRAMVFMSQTDWGDPEDFVGRSAAVFGPDALMDLAIGIQNEHWMLKVYGPGWSNPLNFSRGPITPIGTTHGTVNGAEAARAEAAYRRALAANPNLNEAHVRLGRVFWMLDRIPEATAEWRLVLDNPNSAPSDRYLANLFLGQVLEHGDHTAEAEDAYRAAIGAYPDGQAARAAVSRLCLLSGRAADAWTVMTERSAGTSASRPDPWVLYKLGSLFWSERDLLQHLRSEIRK
jgi:tetratricopeptide (TPR) repeat protein